MAVILIDDLEPFIFDILQFSNGYQTHVVVPYPGNLEYDPKSQSNFLSDLLSDMRSKQKQFCTLKNWPCVISASLFRQ